MIRVPVGCQPNWDIYGLFDVSPTSCLIKKKRIYLKQTQKLNDLSETLQT